LRGACGASYASEREEDDEAELEEEDELVEEGDEELLEDEEEVYTGESSSK
jgi:hypothetical protein